MSQSLPTCYQRREGAEQITRTVTVCRRLIKKLIAPHIFVRPAGRTTDERPPAMMADGGGEIQLQD